MVLTVVLTQGLFGLCSSVGRTLAPSATSTATTSGLFCSVAESFAAAHYEGRPVDPEPSRCVRTGPTPSWSHSCETITLRVSGTLWDRVGGNCWDKVGTDVATTAERFESLLIRAASVPFVPSNRLVHSMVGAWQHVAANRNGLAVVFLTICSRHFGGPFHALPAAA